MQRTKSIVGVVALAAFFIVGEVPAQTLHVLLVADTEAKDIGQRPVFQADVVAFHGEAKRPCDRTERPLRRLVGDTGGLAGIRCAGDQRQDGHDFLRIAAGPGVPLYRVGDREMGENACRSRPETITHQSNFQRSVEVMNQRDILCLCSPSSNTARFTPLESWKAKSVDPRVNRPSRC